MGGGVTVDDEVIMNSSMEVWLSSIALAASAGYVLIHPVRVVVRQRLESRSAAAIIFGTGILLLNIPRDFFPRLPASAWNALSLVALVTILASASVEVTGRCSRGQEKP